MIGLLHCLSKQEEEEPSKRERKDERNPVEAQHREKECQQAKHIRKIYLKGQGLTGEINSVERRSNKNRPERNNQPSR